MSSEFEKEDESMKAVVYYGNKGVSGHGQEFLEVPDQFVQSRDWAAYEKSLGAGVKLCAIRFCPDFEKGEEMPLNMRREGDTFVDVNPDEES